MAVRVFVAGGSVAEAEDAVQETWLRWQGSPAQPTSAKAFLSATVTRISIDVLRSARVRREKYAGPWFPEPLLTDPYQDGRLGGRPRGEPGPPTHGLTPGNCHYVDITAAYAPLHDFRLLT